MVAAACDRCTERAVAALQLLQALQSRIHGSLRGLWPIRISCMLQYLEGKVLVRRAGLRRAGGGRKTASQHGGGEPLPSPFQAASVEAGGSDLKDRVVPGVDGAIDVPVEGRSGQCPPAPAGTVLGAGVGPAPPALEGRVPGAGLQQPFWAARSHAGQRSSLG